MIEEHWEDCKDRVKSPNLDPRSESRHSMLEADPRLPRLQNYENKLSVAYKPPDLWCFVIVTHAN